MIIHTKCGREILIDDEDAHHAKGAFVRKNGYAQTTRGFLHRAIMGYPAGMEVDHINRNKLDNRRGNLRIVTHAENSKNKGQWAKSGHKFIYKAQTKKWQGWRFVIPMNGKLKTVGNYPTMELAVAAKLAHFAT